MTKVAAAVRQERTESANDTPGRIKPLLDAVRQKLEKAEALQNKKKILVVDDNAFIREMLARLLELEHFKVVTAEDGRDALAVVESEHPDLIVTDFNMPYMDGAQLVRHLRGQKSFSALPILVITAYGHWAAA